MSTYFPAGLQTYNLQSSISSTQTTITLTSFKVPVSGADVTMSLMNTSVAFGTIAPKTTQSEFISFTGITQNADGTATLTGVTRGLDRTYPLTTNATFKLPHAGASQFIISDAPQVFNKYSVIENAETITGLKTFPGGGDPAAPVSGTIYAAPTNSLEYASKGYVDATAVAGAPDATQTVKGIVEIATTTEINSGAATGGTGASVVTRPQELQSSIYGLQLPTSGEKASLVGNNTDIAVGSGNKVVTQTGLQHNAEKYAADAGANDTYVITLSPAPTSYTNGMIVYFKANTINTGAATLNVNSLGAKTIVKGVSTTLENGDIPASSFNTVIYDGTNFVLQNPTLTSVKSQAGAPVDTGNVTTTTNVDTVYTTTFTPKTIVIQYTAQGLTGAGSGDTITGIATYDGATIISNVSGSQATFAATDFSKPANGSNGGFVVSIISLTSTGFTFRVAFTAGATFNGCRVRFALNIFA